jgi:hypothetical protein
MKNAKFQMKNEAEVEFFLFKLEFANWGAASMRTLAQ